MTKLRCRSNSAKANVVLVLLLVLAVVSTEATGQSNLGHREIRADHVTNLTSSG
jgi:hypothetical protein